jgi:hypothetical protein
MPDEPRTAGAPLIIPHFTRSILTRSLFTWAFVRAAAIFATAAAEGALRMEDANPLAISPFAALLVVAIVGAVGWVSARRRNEDAFLLCLGIGRARQLGTMIAPAALLELAIGFAVAW